MNIMKESIFRLFQNIYKLQKLPLNLSGYFDTKVFIAKKNNKVIKTIFSKYKNNLIIISLIILFFIFSILKYQLHKRK